LQARRPLAQRAQQHRVVSQLLGLPATALVGVMELDQLQHVLLQQRPARWAAVGRAAG